MLSNMTGRVIIFASLCTLIAACDRCHVDYSLSLFDCVDKNLRHLPSCDDSFYTIEVLLMSDNHLLSARYSDIETLLPDLKAAIFKNCGNFICEDLEMWPDTIVVMSDCPPRETTRTSIQIQVSAKVK